LRPYRTASGPATGPTCSKTPAQPLHASSLPLVHGQKASFAGSQSYGYLVMTAVADWRTNQFITPWTNPWSSELNMGLCLQKSISQWRRQVGRKRQRAAKMISNDWQALGVGLMDMRK